MKVKKNIGKYIEKIIGIKELPVIVLTILIIIFLSVTSPVFLSVSNWIAVLTSLPSTMIASIFMTILLIAGCIDLSVGSVAAASGAVCGLLLLNGIPIPICIISGVLVGIGFGLINGFFSTKFGVAPFIVTLGTMMIGRGVVFVLLKGYGISGFPQTFNNLGQGKLLSLEYPIYLMIIILAISWFILHYFRFSKSIYYIGDNPENARLLGINVNRIRILAFIGSGMMAALSGLVITARFGAASNQTGLGLELQVIVACVIGGTTIYGGEGSLLGTIIGVFFLALLNNAFNLLGVSIYWKDFCMSLILILAISINAVGKQFQLKKFSKVKKSHSM